MTRNSTRILLVLGGSALLTAIITAVFVWPLLDPAPTHADPAEVVSTATTKPAAGYEAAAEQAAHRARTLVADKNLPGLSIAVARAGNVVWAEGFGWADMAKKTPVTPATRFRIGSTSKALTSAGAALLAARGELDLDAPIQTYVPSFPQKKWPVTTRQLMAHTAAIGDDAMPARSCRDVVDALSSFMNEPLRFEPGTSAAPSTSAWILVSAAVQAAARQPFATFMQSEVFAPLGMTHTSVDIDANVASFYVPRMRRDPRHGLEVAPPTDYSCYGGAGAFLSTPSDLARFGSAMLTAKLLDRDSIAKLQTPTKLRAGETTGYGLGWEIESVRIDGEETRMVGHAGDSIGGTTIFMTFPDHGVVIAVTSNVSHAEGVKPFAIKIAEMFVRHAAMVSPVPPSTRPKA